MNEDRTLLSSADNILFLSSMRRIEDTQFARGALEKYVKEALNRP